MGRDEHGRVARSHAAGLLASVLGAFLMIAAGACTSHEGPRAAASQDVSTKTVVMPIEGMSCSACVARIKKTLTSIDGVSDVEVNLAARDARVRFDPSKLSADRLVAAVTGLGYKAGPATEEPALPATGGGRRPQHRSEEPALPATGGGRRPQHRSEAK